MGCGAGCWGPRNKTGRILAMMVFTFLLGETVSVQVNKILEEMNKVDELEGEE